MDTTTFSVDLLQGVSPEADCLECLVALPDAIQRLREARDDPGAITFMISHTKEAFRALDARPRQNLLMMAAGAQDQLYRHIAALTILDTYTRFYFRDVIRYFFAQLSERNVRTFYVLDNALRDDRLALVLELFDLAGISTTTPRRDGKKWESLATRMRHQVQTAGHVAYIEPDAEVNYIEAAKALARDVGCVATFRNLGIEDPHMQLLAPLKAQGEPRGGQRMETSQIDVKAEIDRYFDDSSIPKGAPPRAVIIHGATAVGKTTIRRERYSAGFVILDAAEIFLSLCRGRYLDFPGPLEEPMELVGFGVARRITRERRHFVTEIIAAQVDPTNQLIDALGGAGYLVDFVGVTCDVAIAWERNVNRGDNNISAYYTEPYHRRWLLASL